jgi:hypothetical protein
VSADALAVSVDVEFDCGGRDHTGKTGSQAAEEGSPSLSSVDVTDYPGCLVFCVLGIGDLGDRGRGGRGGRCRGSLVEVGLEACTEDIERGSCDCSCESTATI